jgi:esterase/lipase superfamily enzyme
MNIEYCKWHSPALGQQMELKVYGFFGKPLLVFPAQGGRFYEFEDFGMIAAITPFIEAGQIKVFTLDSIDSQSWANLNAPPADRARRHEDYDRYITQEVAPFIIQHCGDIRLLPPAAWEPIMPLTFLPPSRPLLTRSSPERLVSLEPFHRRLHRRDR